MSDQECIVCGKQRFLVKGHFWSLSPFICSEKCAEKELYKVDIDGEKYPVCIEDVLDDSGWVPEFIQVEKRWVFYYEPYYPEDNDDLFDPEEQLEPPQIPSLDEFRSVFGD